MHITAFDISSDDVKTIGETVVFRVNLVVDGSEKLIADTVAMITTNLIKSASIVVEVNEKIGTPFTKELQARLNMNLKLAIGGGATLMSVLGGGSGGKKKNKKKGLGKSKEPQLLSVLTSRMREANLKIKTDTVQEALALVVGSPAPFNNFSDVRPLISMLLAEVRPSTPSLLISEYFLSANIISFLGMRCQIPSWTPTTSPLRISSGCTRLQLLLTRPYALAALASALFTSAYALGC